MTVKLFKSKIKEMETEFKSIMRVVEGPGIGLIGLNSQAKFKPCCIIAEGKHDYFYINEDDQYGACPKKEYQIVQR